MNEPIQFYGHFDRVTREWGAPRFAFEYEANSALRDYPVGHNWQVRKLPLDSKNVRT